MLIPSFKVEVLLDTGHGVDEVSFIKLRTFSSCNMGMSGLPDMYTRKLEAEVEHIGRP